MSQPNSDQSATPIVWVSRRRAKLVRRLNKLNLTKFLEMYADDATLRDPDQSLIVGKNDLREYYTQHFTFSRMLGTPQMQLTSTRTQVKGEFIYDIGEYSWSAIRSGRYVHKWAWIKDDYYLISDRFTIEQMQPLFELNNDENADAGNEDMDTGV